MNAKHLFLTLIICACSICAWADDVLTATDVISPATIVAKSYDGVLENYDYNDVSGWVFESTAQYASGRFYFDSDDEVIIGLEASSSLSMSCDGKRIKSISIAWYDDEASNNDEGLAVVQLYARNGTPYTGSENSSTLDEAEKKHTFTYKDGVTTYNFTGDYTYAVLAAFGPNYGAFFTSISITWEWIVRDDYTINEGTINEGVWGENVTVSPTTAHAGDEITITFAPKKVKSGKKWNYYSLTSYAFDGMEFSMACREYVTNPETYTVTFPMPARDVTVDATFELVTMTETKLTIDMSVTEVGSGEELVIPFTHLNATSSAPIPGYSGTITAVATDGTILDVDAPVKVSDGNYTFTVHGKALGSTVVTVTASAQAETKSSFGTITIEVLPRNVALVAQYSGGYYVMKNTVSDNMADAMEVYYDSDNDLYYYDAGATLANYTWNAADPAAKKYTIQNPSSSKYLTYGDFLLSEESSSYQWGKDAYKRFTNIDSWGIVYDGSHFLAGSTMANAAREELISIFRPMNYSTETSSAGIYDARTLSDGSWGTICVPFDVADVSAAGAEFYTLTGKHVEDDNIVGFYISDAVSSLTAGHSYLYQVSGGSSAINLNGSSAILTEAVVAAKDGFVGVLPNDNGGTGKIRVENESKSRVDGNYVMSGGKFRYLAAGGAANVKAYRAYVDASELDAIAAAAPGRRLLRLETMVTDDQPTDIIINLTDEVIINWNEPVYNIMGMQVGKGATGVLIQNGQKFIVQ